MTFYEWLTDWIDISRKRRDMWGAFAYWLDNWFHHLRPPEAGWDDYNVVAACLGLDVGDVKRFMLAELHMTYQDHLTKVEWETKEAADRSPGIHPCSSWLHSMCDCGGSCSCHWKQTVVNEDGPPVEITDLDPYPGGTVWKCPGCGDRLKEKGTPPVDGQLFVEYGWKWEGGKWTHSCLDKTEHEAVKVDNT